MKILSIDTASDICGVSILDNNKLIYNLDTNTRRTHSENLMPLIATELFGKKGAAEMTKAIRDIFKNTNLNINDIDMIVCDIGPRFIYRY